MSAESWIAVAVGIITIITSVAMFIRWLVKHYLDELRPNHGSSIKDQITRLESKQQELEKKMDSQHNKLEKKIDKMFDALLDHLSSNSK
jgi:uncharacterized membrane-anchored protein YhcB (DUF1043 family)